MRKHQRVSVIFVGMYLLFFAVACRLAYWQLIKGSQLQAEAEDQYTATVKQTSQRGRILTSEGYPLVENQPVFRFFAEPQLLPENKEPLVKALVPLLLNENQEYKTATDEALRKTFEAEIEASLKDKLHRDARWIALAGKISEETRQAIEDLKITGFGFDPYQVRYYPEASLAAHVTGFVGKNDEGEDIGYFGVEGALDKELRGLSFESTGEYDALGLPLFFNTNHKVEDLRGRDIKLTIRRDMQATVENLLEKGVERYGAKSGEVVVMDPKTGKVLALAAYPKYNQADFYNYPPELYKNPTLAHLYEPGSTFKTLTVSAGIDTGKIEPETQCDQCAGPKSIGKYTIKTWNDEYHPQITMTDALAKSDNTAMIFIAEKIGNEVFYDYVEKFGIGSQLQIELQEDGNTPFEKKSGQIDLATASFGQGVQTSSLQLVRAVATIANQGVMMRPYIVESVIDPVHQTEISTKPIIEHRVISPESAQKVTQMMVSSAEHGEAQWIRSASHTIAGKTGTSQVAINGEYDPDKTIASFIGFAPAYDPQFVMIVKLVEPSSSPWAAETASPLWYQIANRLFLLLNIPPDKN